MKVGGRVLIVDDEVDMLEVCEDTLTPWGIAVSVESKPANAIPRLRREQFDVLITDLKMPGMDGVELFRRAKELDEALVVIIFTAFPTVESALETLKLGAFDYLTKPFTPDQLSMAVHRALKHRQLKEENLFLGRQVERTFRFDHMLGRSPAMLRIFELISRVAPTDSDVFITGETGTGKELVARSLHARSLRKHGRFVPVDCGAIPEHLLESEFFGHERGAFTGAVASRMGLLEFAKGGTLFLDEVCELPIPLQAKLLRCLQERRYRRVGGTEEHAVDVRVVAATNRNPEEEVKAGRFRQDLYYRLNVVRVEVPPLRERAGDIPLLATHFLERYAKEWGRKVGGVDHETLEALMRYPWPGNVRELQNVMKRAVATVKDGQLTLADVLVGIPPDGAVMPLGKGGGGGEDFFQCRSRVVADFERTYLTSLLTRYQGEVTKVSEASGLPISTLYFFFKKHALKPADFRERPIPLS